MRVLWASHIVPYPPKSGVHLRSYHLLRGVAARHDVDLIAFVQEAWLDVFFRSREEGLQECRRALGEFCRSVCFLPIESATRPGGKWRTALAGLLLPSSYTIRWLDSPRARRTFAEAAGTQGYALVHFDTIGLAPYRATFKGTAATLGHHNIESHMLLRRAENETSPMRRLYYLQEGKRVQTYEKQTAGDFALHITCSDLDSQRLRKIAPAATVVTIPNGVDLEYFRATGADASRRSIVFVGSLNWYPNISAVEFLLREIWPQLQQAFPDLTLDIVGSAPPRALVDLASAFRGVTVHGFVDDVRPLMDAATLYVCPIRDGGGTKLKLLDAFAMQKCVIAHPVACEGIGVTPGRDVELADSAQSFVAAIARLLEQPERRRQIGRAARELVEQRYAFEGIGNRLCDVFESVASATGSGSPSARP
jgi:glycosyltransferase involved in cell wall biosynthesis